MKSIITALDAAGSLLLTNRCESKQPAIKTGEDETLFLPRGESGDGRLDSYSTVRIS